MTTVDIKNISVYNFLEIANAKWMINNYLRNIPDVEVEYFNEEEEKDINSSREFINFQNIVNQKFSWK